MDVDETGTDDTTRGVEHRCITGNDIFGNIDDNTIVDGDIGNTSARFVDDRSALDDDHSEASVFP
jgi:hypothetical protein